MSLIYFCSSQISFCVCRCMMHCFSAIRCEFEVVSVLLLPFHVLYVHRSGFAEWVLAFVSFVTGNSSLC